VAADGQEFCRASELTVELGPANGAAGTTYGPLRFTNVSDSPCIIQGFPGVSYVAGDDGHQVGRPADRTGKDGPTLTLRPGQTAHAEVGFLTVANYPEGRCAPTPVRGLRVYPPQETASVFVRHSGTGCAKDVHQLSVRTVLPGPGQR
jgi:hypothetical protein